MFGLRFALQREIMTTRLTAMDVDKQEFPRQLRGYAADDVRLYLRSVAEEIERLNLENGTLREEAGQLRERLEDFRERERMLQETLVSAQRMTEQMKEKSQRESDLLIKEARIKAERLLEQAQDQLLQIENEIGRLRLERDAFETRLRSGIEEHLALLDLRKKETGELDNLRFLRRRTTTGA
jgi:cell division initiation protein